MKFVHQFAVFLERKLGKVNKKIEPRLGDDVRH